MHKKTLLKKQITSLLIIISATLLLCSSFTAADTPPAPGAPHRFWGTIADTQGNPVQNDTIVKAVVDNENYTTTVINGRYGYHTPFYVEDPNNDNQGKTIYFYVHGINTNQTRTFSPFGTTELNLTVDLNQNDSGDNNNQQPPSDSDETPDEPENQSPVADTGGPYFGAINKTIHFNASDSYDLDGEIISYNWNFGDNSTGGGMTTQHTYTTVGTYTLTLMVKDDQGSYDTDETTVKVMYDSDDDGWGDNEELEYGTDPQNASDYPEDYDNDHIPNSNDTDNDNDGLTDVIEQELGSDAFNTSDVTSIVLNGTQHYLVDTTNDANPNIFYNTLTGNHTNLSLAGNNTYLIDTDGDGQWDYTIDMTTGSITEYVKEDKTDAPYVLLVSIVVAILVVASIIWFMYKKRWKKKE